MSVEPAGRSARQTVGAVAAVLLGLTAVAAAVASYATGLAHSSRFHATWWAFAPAFALAQACVVNIQVKREARSLSLTEIPAVIGLFALSPAMFVAARVSGGVIAQVVARRQHRQPVKLAFNTVLVACEGLTTIAVFRLLAQGAAPTYPRAWLGAILAAVVGNVVGGAAVAVLIARLDDSPLRDDLVRVVTECIPQAAAGASVGVVAVLALEATTWAALPLAAVAVLVLLAYRVYADLRERHDTVERLYRFSEIVIAGGDSDNVLSGILEHVCEMMRADAAQLTFFVNDDRRADTEAVLRRGEGLQRRPPRFLTPDATWLVDTLCAGRSVLLARGSKDLAARHWLHVRGLREAMVVPLRGEQGVIGAVSVTDRLGESRGFDIGDLRLLETVANHASVALSHGRLVDRLRHDSLHDALTGAPNRAYLHLEIQRLLDALPDEGRPFAVAMLDLNSFKDVNDTLGHHHGDGMLREVAQRLTSTLAGRALVARFGGDEFAVLFPACDTAETASRLCRLMLDTLRRPVDIDGTAVDVGASVGIALAPTHAASIEQLLKRADVAMYVAKQSGRDIVIFDPAHETTSPSRLALAAALRQAIADGVIDIHVQPQMVLGTGRVASVEALARWSDVDHGEVGPEEFVALAERTGLIGQLTELALDKAIAACAAWQPFAPGVAIAVNLSARSLRDDAFDEQVGRLLKRHRLPANLLTLEITESSVMADPESTLGLLLRLRERGIRLSIDDFGTGYSSLAYLRRLPVQEVKVDRAFVQKMDTESDDAAIVGAIIELAHTLELEVVAEGIETAEVAQLLQGLGCERGQGYHLARPMPVEAFAAWMASAPQQRRPRRLLAIAGDP